MAQHPSDKRRPFWVERVRGGWGVRWFFYGVLGLSVVLDGLMTHEHAGVGWGGWPGFAAVYGLASCGVIIGLAKGLGHGFLGKREDYYD